MNVLRSVLASLDTAVLEWMHRHATPSGMAVGLTVSRVGSPLAMTVLAFAGALLLATLEEWIVLGGWVMAFGGAGVLDHWLKILVHRPRPAYATALLHHPTWSFPSGHAMGALVGYGMLAYVVVLLTGASGKRRTLIVTSAAVLITVIGLSRLYLGVHYLSDVIGGYAVGSTWLALCIWGVETSRRIQAQPRLDPMG